MHVKDCLVYFARGLLKDVVLFNDAVKSSEYMALNVRIINPL
jgi:hypothetical protein